MFVLARRLRPLVAAATLAVTAGSAAPASARILEVGRTDAAPACPASPCLALSRTTGYQVTVGHERGDFRIPLDGKIVAWSIRLGTPTERQVGFFDTGLGGAASAGIMLLRQGKRFSSRAMASSPVERLEPYFGQTVQFPLDTAIPVKQGWMLGLTVPTWAPALTRLLRDHSAWRASRPVRRCADTSTQTAQRKRLALARYECLYQARMTYSATLVTDPVPTERGSGGR